MRHRRIERDSVERGAHLSILRQVVRNECNDDDDRQHSRKLNSHLTGIMNFSAPPHGIASARVERSIVSGIDAPSMPGIGISAMVTLPFSPISDTSLERHVLMIPL